MNAVSRTLCSDFVEAGGYIKQFDNQTKQKISILI
jgi:hypothetical protein